MGEGITDKLMMGVSKEEQVVGNWVQIPAAFQEDCSTGVRRLGNSSTNSCPSVTVPWLLVQTETLGRCPLGEYMGTPSRIPRISIYSPLCWGSNLCTKTHSQGLLRACYEPGTCTWDYYHQAHFMDGETEAQRSYLTCPGWWVGLIPQPIAIPPHRTSDSASQRRR